MNYKEIVDAAKAYTDRYDEELASAMLAFTRVVEGKINNALRTGDQSVRAQIWLEREQEYYTLPCDWGGARDVEILHEGRQHGRTLVYLAPEEMNKLKRERDSSVRGRHYFYTIIAGQIQVAPPTVNERLVIVFYQRLPQLEGDCDCNWLTEKIQTPTFLVFALRSAPLPRTPPHTKRTDEIFRSDDGYHDGGSGHKVVRSCAEGSG